MGFGRGRGFRGGGRGWRHWFYATGLPGWARFGATAMPQAQPDPGLWKQALKAQAQALQSELEAINKRISEIETSAEAE